ncbi:MAG: nuclear transport factor 2 family protein [Erythrobacter sp.]|nr:MAG: nuclear transport factor 2 family protein [Erythrobacter sp.]
MRFLTGLAALAALLLPGAALAQETPAEAEVIATINTFMAAFADKDGEAMAALLADNAFRIAVREGEGGDPVLSMPMHDVVMGIANVSADIAEPISITQVLVDGPVAMVWADYAFYLNGERSHCGVDVFTLVRVAGEWKIATVTDSYIADDCEDAPTP